MPRAKVVENQIAGLVLRREVNIGEHQTGPDRDGVHLFSQTPDLESRGRRCVEAGTLIPSWEKHPTPATLGRGPEDRSPGRRIETRPVDQTSARMSMTARGRSTGGAAVLADTSPPT